MTRRILYIFICIQILTACMVLVAVYCSVSREMSDANASPSVIISEVCANNITTAHDENGNYGANYVELYNATDEPINVAGWGLSDSHDDFYEFVLPDIEIDAHSCIVLWDDDLEIDMSAYLEDYVVRDIHDIDISISAQGDRLYLTDSEGRTVYTMAVPGGMEDGQSYQVTLDDTDRYIYGEPTLYSVAENDEVIALSDAMTLLDNVEFSVDGGWYDEPITVELSCERGEIYYTTDGSEPDENATRYDGPIIVENRSDQPNIYSAIENISTSNRYLPEDLVDKCTVIKAVAVDGEARSDVTVRSYFVGLNVEESYQNVAVISLTADPDDLFDYYDGIYTYGSVFDNYVAKYDDRDDVHHSNYAMEGRGWERPAQIEYYTADHDEVLRQNIGIRIHGGVSVSFNQKGFNLYAREEYDGNDTFQYAFWGNTYSKLMLRTGGCKDCYLTKFRDVLNQNLMHGRAVGCQEAIPCVVFLNGEYWGLYNLQETVGADYVEAEYGIEEENAIVFKNPWELDDPEVQLYNDVVSYAGKHDLSVEENYEWMEEHLDIQSYIDYYCLEIYIANVDSIRNNYAVWRSRDITDQEYGDGKWRFLFYDTDDSTAIIEEKTEADNDSFIQGHWWEDPLGEEADTLFSSLMENQEFKERFVTTFMDLANENLAYEHVHAQLYALAEQYCDADIASQQRFRGDYNIIEYTLGLPYDGWYTEEDYWGDVKVIDDFYRDRRQYIVAYMKQDLELVGDLADIAVRTNIDNASEVHINTLTIDGATDAWQGQYYTDYPVQLSCEPDDGYEFSYWMVNGDIVSRDESLTLNLTDAADGQTMNVEAILEPAA